MKRFVIPLALVSFSACATAAAEPIDPVNALVQALQEPEDADESLLELEMTFVDARSSDARNGLAYRTPLSLASAAMLLEGCVASTPQWQSESEIYQTDWTCTGGPLAGHPVMLIARTTGDELGFVMLQAGYVNITPNLGGAN